MLLNPESVILNSVQNLFRAGPVQHLTNTRTYRTLKQVQGDKSRLFIRPLIKEKFDVEIKIPLARL
jgi:hypothetical protein